MIEIQERENGRLLEVRISGQLRKTDYEQYVPYVENLIVKLGRLSVLVDLREFHGWDLGAIWQDIKFDARHFRDIDRVALVGQTRWQKLMATACKPFTMAKVRVFAPDQMDQAREWVSAARWGEQAAA